MYHRHTRSASPARIARVLVFCLLNITSLSGMAAPEPLSEPDGALHWWIASAEAGRPEHQYNLGRMYEVGIPALNLPSDATRALYWYQRAAAQGHAAAQSALVRLKEREIGAEVTSREAITPASQPNRSHTPVVATAPVARYWPWWQGGLVLAAIVLGFWLALGAPLGVSSSWERIVSARAYRRAEAADRRLAYSDAAVVTDALLAETLRQFGPAALTQMKTGGEPAPPPSSPKLAPLPWAVHITFLVSLMLGGFLAAASTETFTLKLTLGDAFTNTIGDGWTAVAVLAVGGVFIGFGTRMAGGCSSGHGISGCARLQPGSLLATASFFGGAALLTLLLVNS